MKFKCQSRCHFCKVPLNPYIEVIGTFEYLKAVTWSCICPIDVTANDRWLRILSYNKTVPVCRDCYKLKYYKTNFKGLLDREITGKSQFKKPIRLAKTDNDLLGWQKYMDLYNRQPDALTFYDLDMPYLPDYGPGIVTIH